MKTSHAFFYLILFPLLLLISCVTTSNMDQPLELEPSVAQFADIAVSVTPLTEQDLKNRYGSMANYFSKYPGLLPRKNIFIMQVDVETETTNLKIRYDISNITDGEINNNPLSIKDIESTLGYYISETEMERFMALVERDYTEGIQYVHPGEPYRYYYIFLSRLERGKELTLQIPASTKEGDAGLIEIPVFFPQFDDDVIEKEEKNSGIFLEQ